ncbi:DNA gyrase subunit A [Rhodothalassium salexigens]|uniref:DNA gyrase subunit A n=1 Tax=Rhodothalassium salexigens TaxID=1086 RepID=UPI0019132C8D|nr:DNA gyrase subunit A [Rhodothalassium salexigens]MBK5921756.1 DNA gyrase subunit A [Rhodothalassium salexigens]
MTPPDDQDIRPIDIEDEMQASYLDYAMSVIVSRALPDVRDGLKPVHRRILYSMNENGYSHDKPYRKSARIVGDVMGKYHPHGDSSIYDALVRMAQDFSMRLPVIDGQGNFGSMDGDSPAAMRYTEARLAKVSTTILTDIDKNTVDYQDNYDGAEREPTVLPARFPNLLVNGAGGIAVGMATNIPPHNLGEVVDATLALIDDPALTNRDLMDYVKGPDFPTGAVILGASGIAQAYETGRGSITLRSKSHTETVRSGREAIVITEVPYQVNKAAMVEKIAEQVKLKKIEGIADLRDESDRDGVRVVIELKREAMADVVLNQLYRFTPVQTSFGINMLALNGGRPEQMSLRDVLKAFVGFREEVITRRTKFELGKARDRAHVMVGLVTAVANIDEVVATIRGSSSPAEARATLMARDWDAAEIVPYLRLTGEIAEDAPAPATYRLSETQVRAILELRLHRLTALGRDEIGKELEELAGRIREYLEILRSRAKLYEVLRAEMVAVRDEFATPRRTEIDLVAGGDFDEEDLIQQEDMVVTVTHAGYIKRVPLSTYRAQKRGGRGRSGMATKDEDFVTTLFVANTHQPLLFFTDLGRVYRLKVWRLPLGTPQARGKALVNLLPLDKGEIVTTVLALPQDEAEWETLNVMFATARGNVRRNLMSDFANVPSNGKIAIRFEDGTDDRLVGVMMTTPDQDVLLATAQGKCIRFPVDEVRVFKGRTSTGVRGMRLAEGDEVITVSILDSHGDLPREERDQYLRAAPWKQSDAEPELSAERMAELAAREQFILTLTGQGFGKRTSAFEYRRTGRGGQGLWNVDSDETKRQRIGPVVAVGPVHDGSQIMLMTDQGQVIRTGVDEIRIAGRATLGVRVFRVGDDERVVSAAKIDDVDGNGDEDEAETETGVEIADTDHQSDAGAPDRPATDDAAGDDTDTAPGDER